MAANKETRILKSNTLEQFRQKSNEISLHLGDNEQLGGQFADKVYNLVDVSAGSLRFFGNDDNSKTIRFEIKPEESLDNTAGYLILNDVSSLTGFGPGATISQSGGFSATVVSSTTEKILLTNTSGTYNTSQTITDNSSNTIAAANHDRVHSESFNVGVVRVYKNNVELNQDLSAGGFHVATLAARLPLTGSPDVSEITEGSIINQAGGFSGTVLHASSSQVLFKAVTGSFNTNQVLTIRNHPDSSINNTTVLSSAQTGAIVSFDTAYGNAIELNTPAAANDDIKIFSANLVDALNELQGDIGSVESLTTTATTLQGGINEHDAELGTITAGAMGTTASTVSGAIAEHETQLGNTNFTSIASTISGSLTTLHGEIGDISALDSSLGNNLVDGLNNIEAVFDASTKEISAGSNAFNITSGALTLDSSGDITIDADGGDIILKDGGTEYGRLSQVLGGLTLKSGASAANAIIFDGSGNQIVAGNISIADSKEINFGTDDDLKIYHDGSDSYIDEDGTGNFNIRTNGLGISFVHTGGSVNMAQMTQFGTSLMYNGSAKLTTVAGGVNIIGEVEADSLDIDGAGDISGNLAVGGNTTVAGNETITGNLTVNGSTVDINANADVSGTMVIGSTLGVTGVTTLGANLGVTGNVTASGEVEGGSLDINGAADISGNLTIGTLATSSQHVKGAIAEHEGDIGNMTLTGVTATDLSGAIRELATEAGAISFVGGGPADTANPTNLTSAVNAIDAEIGNTSYTGSDITSAISTTQTNIGTIGSLATSAGNLVSAVNELHTEVNANATNIASNDTDISTINTNIGSLASLTTSANNSIVNAINSVEDEVDVLQTGQGTLSSLDTAQKTNLVGALNELHGEINTNATNISSNDTDISNLQSGKINLTDANEQTINSDLSFTNGKTFTFASGTTLDLSSATLTLGGGGSTLNFNTAFIELDVNSNQQGLKVKRESITGVSSGSADAQFRWNEGTSDQALGWEVVYPNPSDDGGSITSSLVTFENARNLISGAETGISVSFDDTNNRYDFGVNVDNSTIEIDSGNLRVKNSGITTAKINNLAVTTGKIAASAVTTAKIANSAVTNAKLQHDHFTVTDGSTSTDIALNDTLTFSGTTDEVTVAESSGTITIGLPDDVTIAGNLTVNGTTTTINTANLDIEDSTIRFAKNATTLLATNGAGLEFGASASKPTILWDNTNTRLTTNKQFHSSVGFKGDGSQLTSIPSGQLTGTISDARLPATITSNITGDVTGNVTGNITGNAGTATKLSSARTFALTGDITGSVSSDLTTGASITTNISSDTVGPAEMIVGGTPADGKAIIYQSGAHQYSTISFTDTNTKYQINTVDSGNDAIIRLTSTGDDAGVTDDITLAAGSNITITESGDTITIASTDTNTQLSTSDVRSKFSAGNLIDITSGQIDVDLTELPLETANVAGTDHLVYVDNGTQKKIAFSNVNLSAFDNTASGFVTSSGVTDVTVGTGLDVSGTTTKNITLDLSELTDLTTAMAGTDELVILDDSVQKRKSVNEIGLSLFNNDANFSTTTGTVTSVGTNTGLSGTVTTSGNLSLALQDLPDMTQTWSNTVDELIVLDGGVQKRKRSAEIPLSAFNNDGGFTNNVGDITRVSISAGDALSGTVVTDSGAHTQTISLDHLGFEDLTDPNDDRIAYWDDSEQKFEWLDIGSNLSITAGALNAASTNVATNLGNSTTTTAVTITSSDGNNTTLSGATTSAAGVMTAAQVTTLNGLVSDTGTPAITSNGSSPSLNTGISADEVRGLIGAGTMSSWTLTDAVSATEAISNGETLNLSDTAYINLRITGSANTRNIEASLNNNFLAFSTFTLVENNGNLISTITADNAQDTFTFKEGTNINLTSTGDTITIDATNTTYTAGTGLDLSGTTFSIENDLRSDVDFIGGSNNNNYIDMANGGYVDFIFDNLVDFRFLDGGTLHADNDIIAFSTTTASDKKLKENIQKVDNALELVCKLDGVTFDWKDKDRGSSAGVIAQNVEEVLPSAVNEIDQLNNNDTYKVVDYNQLSALFIEAIKELKEQNIELKAEVEKLKSINSNS